MSARTHWDGCWRERSHHDCAVAQIERLKTEARKEERAGERVIVERDEMEDRVNAIASALGLSDAEAEWSNVNDVGVRCVERAGVLRAENERLRAFVAAFDAWSGTYDSNDALAAAREAIDAE